MQQKKFYSKKNFLKNATMQNWFYKLLDCKTLQKILDFFPNIVVLKSIFFVRKSEFSMLLVNYFECL